MQHEMTAERKKSAAAAVSMSITVAAHLKRFNAFSHTVVNLTDAA